MFIEIIVSKPKGSENSALNRLLSLNGFSNTFVSNHYNNEEKISPKSDYAEADGKNIYATFSFSNPQEFYRELSNNGFSLLDSRITR